MYCKTGAFTFHRVEAQKKRLALWQAKIPLGLRVIVVFNKREYCYSILNAKTQKVIAYCSGIVLSDPTVKNGRTYGVYVKHQKGGVYEYR